MKFVESPTVKIYGHTLMEFSKIIPLDQNLLKLKNRINVKSSIIQHNVGMMQIITEYAVNYHQHMISDTVTGKQLNQFQTSEIHVTTNKFLKNMPDTTPSKPCTVPLCKVLPPSEYNNNILEPLSDFTYFLSLQMRLMPNTELRRRPKISIK